MSIRVWLTLAAAEGRAGAALAKELGINPTSLFRQAREYGITFRDDPKQRRQAKRKRSAPLP